MNRQKLQRLAAEIDALAGIVDADRDRFDYLDFDGDETPLTHADVWILVDPRCRQTIARVH